jgi:hypothetical protein
MSMIWHEKQPLDAEFYSHLPDARGGPCMAMPAGLMEGRLAINVLASMEKQIGRAYMGYGWINGCPIVFSDHWRPEKPPGNAMVWEIPRLEYAKYGYGSQELKQKAESLVSFHG